MKALSVKEPWAGLIANGAKTIETRTWNTNYRGQILIVASLKPKTKYSGLAIAIAELVDCRPMELNDTEWACCNIYPKAKSWILSNVRKIKPFKVKGQLGIYNIEIEEDQLEVIHGYGKVWNQNTRRYDLVDWPI